MISASVHTQTVSPRLHTDPAKAVSPNPYPASSAETTSSFCGSPFSMNRVTGICSSTISTPLTAMTSP